MKVENPFRSGDRVIFKGTRRFPELRKGAVVWSNGKHKLLPDKPAHGTVLNIWRKGWRIMVDVSFDHFGNYVVYHDELEFNVLDTLSAL
jgi:hypothetical protein